MSQGSFFDRSPNTVELIEQSYHWQIGLKWPKIGVPTYFAFQSDSWCIWQIWTCWSCFCWPKDLWSITSHDSNAPNTWRRSSRGSKPNCFSSRLGMWVILWRPVGASLRSGGQQLRLRIIAWDLLPLLLSQPASRQLLPPTAAHIDTMNVTCLAKTVQHGKASKQLEPRGFWTSC